MAVSEFWEMSYSEYMTVIEARKNYDKDKAELSRHILQVAIANSFGKKKHELFEETAKKKPKKKANRKELEELIEKFK